MMGAGEPNITLYRISHSLLRWTRVAIVSVFAWACSEPTEPLEYELPAPDLSLDPAALVQPRLLHVCGKWVNGTAPADSKMFVDVEFDRRELSDSDDQPTSRHLAALARHGGQVVYKFHFPAVRAWIPTGNVPALAGDETVTAVFWVDNLRRYDWNARVGYKTPYTYQAGIARYEQLGGRVSHVFNTINAISGLISDQSVRLLREDSNVDYVESAVPFPFPDC